MQMALALLVLGCGMLIGSGATVLLMRHKFTRVRQQRMQPRIYAATVGSKLQTEYDLTDEETQAIERALTQRIDTTLASGQQFIEQFQAARERFMGDLKATLPPAKYAVLKEHYQSQGKWLKWFFGFPDEPQNHTLADLLNDPERKQEQ